MYVTSASLAKPNGIVKNTVTDWTDTVFFKLTSLVEPVLLVMQLKKHQL